MPSFLATPIERNFDSSQYSRQTVGGARCGLIYFKWQKISLHCRLPQQFSGHKKTEDLSGDSLYNGMQNIFFSE